MVWYPIWYQYVGKESKGEGEWELLHYLTNPEGVELPGQEQLPAAKTISTST